MDIHSILEGLSMVDGVIGVFLIDDYGNMIDSVAQNSQESEKIAQVIYSCIDSGNRIAESVVDSHLMQSYIEFSDSNITLDLLSSGAILAIHASPGANLGRIRLEIRKTKKEIDRVLA